MFCGVGLVNGNNTDPGWAGNASITAANGLITMFGYVFKHL